MPRIRKSDEQIAAQRKKSIKKSKKATQKVELEPEPEPQPEPQPEPESEPEQQPRRKIRVRSAPLTVEQQQDIIRNLTQYAQQSTQPQPYARANIRREPEYERRLVPYVPPPEIRAILSQPSEQKYAEPSRTSSKKSPEIQAILSEKRRARRFDPFDIDENAKEYAEEYRQRYGATPAESRDLIRKIKEITSKKYLVKKRILDIGESAFTEELRETKDSILAHLNMLGQWAIQQPLGQPLAQAPRAPTYERDEPVQPKPPPHGAPRPPPQGAPRPPPQGAPQGAPRPPPEEEDAPPSIAKLLQAKLASGESLLKSPEEQKRAQEKREARQRQRDALKNATADLAKYTTLHNYMTSTIIPKGPDYKPTQLELPRIEQYKAMVKRFADQNILTHDDILAYLNGLIALVPKPAPKGAPRPPPEAPPPPLAPPGPGTLGFQQELARRTKGVSSEGEEEFGEGLHGQRYRRRRMKFI